MLLVDLDVAKSHSRPHVSDDNPYSEAHFKTLKYQPQFPERFESETQARAFCQEFFTWYNQEHRHSGIGYMTPLAMHTGQAAQLFNARQAVLDQAFANHPQRFRGRRPEPPALPTQVGINLPKPTPQAPRGATAFDTKFPATGVSKFLTHSVSISSWTRTRSVLRATLAPDKAPSKKQRKRRLDDLMAACKDWVQGKLRPALDQSIAKRFGARDGWQLEVDPDAVDGQCLLFRYPGAFPATEAGYVRPIVKIELGARSDDWPSESRQVIPSKALNPQEHCETVLLHLVRSLA